MKSKSRDRANVSRKDHPPVISRSEATRPLPLGAPFAGRNLSSSPRKIKSAQRLIGKHIKPSVSLVDELIQERRQSARDE